MTRIARRLCRAVVPGLGVACSLLLAPGVAKADFLLNFENGTDGATVNSGVMGITFHDYNGFSPLYSDIRTGAYNAHSDDMNYGSGGYHMNGYVAVWAGPNADARGVKVTFDNLDGTYFKTGYSSYSTFYLDAYFTDGTSAEAVGGSNYGSPMQYLTVTAPTGKFLESVVMHDTGNYWIIDNVSGDTSGVAPSPEPTTCIAGALLLLPFGLQLLRKARAR
jgi:hypothetical protein